MAFEGVCVKTQWVSLGLLGFLVFDLSILALLCVCACRYEGRKV